MIYSALLVSTIMMVSEVPLSLGACKETSSPGAIIYYCSDAVGIISAAAKNAPPGGMLMAMLHGMANTSRLTRQKAQDTTVEIAGKKRRGVDLEITSVDAGLVVSRGLAAEVEVDGSTFAVICSTQAEAAKARSRCLSLLELLVRHGPAPTPAKLPPMPQWADTPTQQKDEAGK